jgi:hypothetical protein
MKKDEIVLKVSHANRLIKIDFFQNYQIEMKMLKKFSDFRNRDLEN